MGSPKSDIAGRENLIVDQVSRWYQANARELPWRTPDTTAWHVLISEVMLQQTPVSRVEPIYLQWIARWPTPRDMANATPADVIRAWGKLGYPRRALRLRDAAVVIATEHNNTVPADYDVLCSLPGVGDYTASAVRAFAYGETAVVLDTNVRRVLARIFSGQQHAPTNAPTVAERRFAESLLPHEAQSSATWSVAAMELGALICKAQSPRCDECPVKHDCEWATNGHPVSVTTKRTTQKFTGTDRQVRGLLLDVLRASNGEVDYDTLRDAWADHMQRDRCLESLMADQLVEKKQDRYQLPM